MLSVSHVTLILENCESLTFKSEDIGCFFADGQERSINRVALNCIAEKTVAKRVFIELKAQANTPQKTFSSLGDDKETMPFDRLSAHLDITSLEVFYEDGTSQHVYVDFEPKNHEDDSENEYQKIKFGKDGQLYIAIGQNAGAVLSCIPGYKDQAAASGDAPFPTLHVIGQNGPHDHVVIVGNSDALYRLMGALEDALTEGSFDATTKIFTNDGEGYTLSIIRRELTDDFPMPYTDEVYCGSPKPYPSWLTTTMRQHDEEPYLD